jgi:hypothetical protein
LNSAFLGLKVVLDDLRDSEDEDEREMYETLHDVHKSCVTAVEMCVSEPHLSKKWINVLLYFERALKLISLFFYFFFLFLSYPQSERSHVLR